MEHDNDEPDGDAAGGHDHTHRCVPTMEDIYRYIDGHLDDSQRARFQSHLRRCGGCDDVYNFEVDLRSFIGSRIREDMPPEARRRVIDALNRLF